MPATGSICPSHRTCRGRIRETAGYEITNREGRAVAVTLPDHWRAECVARQNLGNWHELVRREEADRLIAILEAGIAAMDARLGNAPAMGWQ